MSASPVAGTEHPETVEPKAKKKKKMFGRKAEAPNPVTLSIFVRRALKDVVPLIAADPYLKKRLATLEARGNLKKLQGEIDYRIAKAVDFNLRNREPNDRVRGRVSCVSAADLINRTARIIIIVDAFGHQCREVIDLELPNYDET